MKKFLIAAAASLLIFGGQAQASTIESLNEQMEIQEQGKWAHFRDKHLLHRETENERRDREEWERRHHYDPPPGYRGYGPPPPGHRGYGPPPPGHRGYGPPPPPRR